MPKGKKHMPEQIVAILRRIKQGESAEAVCRSVSISEATLYRWKQQYGAMELEELTALRDENVRLKRLIADQALNIQVLMEVNSKNGEPVAASADGAQCGCGGYVFITAGVPLSRAGAFELRLPAQAPRRTPRANGGGDCGTVVKAPALRLSPGACDGAASRALLRVLSPSRRPRCPARRKAKIKAEGVNHVCCVDLVFDATRHGVTLKFLTIVDEGSHYCIDIAVGRRMCALD